MNIVKNQNHEFLLQQLIMLLLFFNYLTKLFIVSYNKHLYEYTAAFTI